MVRAADVSCHRGMEHTEHQWSCSQAWDGNSCFPLARSGVLVGKTRAAHLSWPHKLSDAAPDINWFSVGSSLICVQIWDDGVVLLAGAQCVENKAIPNYSWVLVLPEEGMGEWRGFFPKQREGPACGVSDLLEAGGGHGFSSYSILGLCYEIPSLCFIKSLLTQVWKAGACL